MDKKIDYLENDTPIPGQNYACLSFLSPEKVLKQKGLFEMYKFFQSLHPETVTETFDNIQEQFEQFKDQHQTKLNKDFSSKNGFHTSIRGLKIRGVYDTLDEAQFRAKRLQNKDPNFNVFVGQVGFWLPWDPNPMDVTNQEYSNDQLNTLMKEYQKNQEKKNIFYEQNKQDMINKNKQENEEKQHAIENLEKKDPWLESKEKSTSM